MAIFFFVFPDGYVYIHVQKNLNVLQEHGDKIYLFVP